MTRKVAIIGLGYAAARATSTDLSYKELTFQTAQKAYADAGLHPREVQSFVTCAEDLNEGTSIFDEYTPDQLGAVQKPMHTVGGDGLHGLGDAVMQIMTGLVDLVVVEAHSKASNMLTPDHVLDYAVDPVWNRPLNLNPHYIAGLEMRRFLHATKTSPEACAAVVARNKSNALKNPAAAYPESITAEDVLRSPLAFDPLREREIARAADGCVVLVLASDDRAKKAPSKPVWVRGVAWANDSPTLESRDWAEATETRIAASRAFKMAGAKKIDIVEVDDTYAYKQLQHLRALGLDGDGAVNPSGGALGAGHTLECSGLYRAAEVVMQIRGQAGPRQVNGAKTGLAHAWRGVPTTSAAIAIFASEP